VLVVDNLSVEAAWAVANPRANQVVVQEDNKDLPVLVETPTLGPITVFSEIPYQRNEIDDLPPTLHLA